MVTGCAKTYGRNLKMRGYVYIILILEEEPIMVNKRIKKSIMALITAVAVTMTATPVWAYVTDSNETSGYGTVVGRQQSLYEDDANMICWVTLETQIDFRANNNVKTAIKYQPALTSTGDELDDEVTVSRTALLCTTPCYLDSYGYYDDIGRITLFSTHSSSGNGYCEPVYLRDVY